jgi:lipopolysaccharide transport system ATP-binding protein
VRLAFAVAAFLEPEILIVDEVLAVGDAEFQKKAIGKMQDVSQNQGRTVLFVSHNMAAVKSLCNLGIVLRNGVSTSIMSAEDAVNLYLEEASNEALKTEFKLLPSPELEHLEVTIQSAKLVNERGQNTIQNGEDLGLEVEYASKGEYHGDLHIGIYDAFGTKISHLAYSYAYGHAIRFSGNGKIYCRIPRLPLAAGRYSINFSLHVSGTPHHRIKNAITFLVHPGNFFKNGKMPPNDQARFLMDSVWEIQ